MAHSAAETRRQEAIGMLSELYLPTPEEPEDPGPAYLCNFWEGRYATGAEVAENVAKLAQLGRTDRWRQAVARWSAMCREARTVLELRLAFLQGMIYAGNAVT